MTLKSEMVGKETFLQNKFLSIGINSSGSLGTRQYAPEGINTDQPSGYLRVGMLADTDGFGVGKAAMRDAVVRGAAIEGFNIGYKTAGKTFVHSNQELDGLMEIGGVATKSISSGAAQSNWKGATNEKLGVDQKITLTDDAKYIRFEVTLTNNSGAAMADLRYMRTVDPDLGEGFSTVNTIVKQGTGSALVTAAAAAGANPMFLYANDTRAVVTTYGFINEDPYAAAVSQAQAVGTKTAKDVSININFDLGKLDAGKSTTVVFYMGVTDNLNATIAEIDALPGTGPVSPTPTNDAPDAIDDTATVVSGQTVKGNVLSNDKDADGDALTAKLKSGPANGTVTLNADGSYAYKAADGFVGSDSFTYTASDGKASDVATVRVSVKAPANVAPNAVNDTLSAIAGQAAKGNVLANDSNANGDALTAVLKTGPSHGTVTLGADGSFVYTAAAGYVGADSFTYAASDGKASDTATVAVSVSAPAKLYPTLPDSALVQRANTVDGSSVKAETLTGVAQHNSFFFDFNAPSGHDRITNFGRDDVIVTKGMFYDGNGDGIIAVKKTTFAVNNNVSINVTGTSSLRYLGTDEAGLSVYAQAGVKPKGALEGKIGDDVLRGDAGDQKKNVFFYDTGLDIHLGDDKIANFGAKDLLVTTSALKSTSLGSDGLVKLVGGSGDATDTMTPGEAGTIEMTGIGGAAVQSLEFDGSMVRNGVTYYVYSQAGSAVDMGDLTF